MAGIQGPVVPRRRIAEELRRLRAETSHTLEEVAEELLVSTSKLSRLENAQGTPQVRDIRDLIRFYGIEGTALAHKLIRWVKDASGQGWWADYTQTLGTGLDVHLAYESEATVARVYTIPVIPVLLQTDDYTRALYTSAKAWWTDDDLDHLLELRSRRKTLLDHREDLEPLRLVAVTHESSIRQLVGSADTMRKQLDYLIERSQIPNVELRIFPFSAQPLFSHTCMYAYFEFSDDLDRDVVNIETHAGFRHIDAPKTVENYRGYHDDLYKGALSEEDSIELIRSVQKSQFSGS